MGKYTKIALVLLYAVQLVLAFREHIVELYRNAAEAVVRHEQAQDRRPSGIDVELKRGAALKFDAHEKVAVAAAGHEALHYVSHAVGSEADGHEERNDDDKKDRARKTKHAPMREFLIANLYPWIKKFVAPVREEEGGDEFLAGILRSAFTSPAKA